MTRTPHARDSLTRRSPLPDAPPRKGRARELGKLCAALLAAAWLSVCADGPTGPEDGQPAALSVTPSAAGPVEVGDEVRLVAESRDAGGRLAAGAAVSWTSSDPRVATVRADGVVTAVGPGTAGITAEAGGISATAQFSVASPDRAALEVLYNATDGPSWTNSTGWLTDAPVGDWHGVTTDSVGRVVGLHLQSNQLSGEIPAELGSLASLEQLYLQRNRLTGGIPRELGGLASLQWLLLNDNALSGAVPAELGRLSALAGLLLNNNAELAGALPLALSSLSALELFRYDGTGLCVPADASFRAWLDAIRTHRGTGVDCAPTSDRDILVALYNATGGPNWVDNTNWLSDAPLGDWYGVDTDANGRVTRLDLRGQRNPEGDPVPHGLTGPIPAELGDLSALRVLFLSRNALQGAIPPKLGNLTELDSLTLGGNQLVGPIPPELGNLDGLLALWLWGNRLTGEIPPELGGIASLRTLVLNANQLTGEIPSELGQLFSLESLQLSANQLTGEIPPELGGLTGLERLLLFSNQLTGEIPSELGQLASLSSLSLSHNQLTGEIPAQLGGIANLQLLLLHGNQLTGEIPSELGQLSSLRFLDLRDNQLTGALPLSLSSLSALQRFWYDGTGLCVSADASFRAWLNALADHRGTGVDCAPPQTDRDILVALYDATGGPDWTNSTGWLTDAPLGDWYGVATNSNGRVVSLELGYNQLTGEIPPELGNLASLTFLSLRQNNLTGSIPTGLGNLTNLTVLRLYENGLTGEIPLELGGIASLEVLYLQDNQLTGEIPAELGGIASLRALYLQDNQLTGEIPSELGGLASLRWLILSGNQLIGALPLTLSSLSSLELFRYDGTGLCVPTDASFRAWLNAITYHQGTGVDCAPTSDRDILVALYNATDGPNWADNTNWLSDAPLGDWYGVDTDAAGRVVRIDLSGRWDGGAQQYVPHGLTGEIPAELGGLASLRFLYLGGNRLTGEIPAQLGGLASLESLVLGRNQLTGGIPSELGNLANLTGLSLDENDLTGEIPSELGGLASLESLDLRSNQLSDEIPAELAQLGNLKWLDLRGNQFTGGIPAELGGLASLERLWLSRNQLTGEMPPELSGLVSLRYLALDGNQLTGEIPPELSGLASLEELSLGINRLTGEVPAELGELASLRYLDLHENRLTGEIPAELGGLATLESLNLWSNRLTGEVPAELGRLASLRSLFLFDNELTGALPLALSSLSALELFYYHETGLCVPTDASFRAWLNALQGHRGTGVDCALPRTDRDVLVALYNATGGPGWTNSTGWLTDASLSDWYGVATNSNGRVTALYLQNNRLTGGIPAELGGLTGLEQLYLQRNQLSGNIPSELGGLASLQWLLLNDNALSGAVPAELGRLSVLAGLLLNNNAELAGALPLALSSLSALRMFRYDGTGLCVPTDASFRAWLNAIRTHQGTGVECEGSSDASLSSLSLSGVPLSPAFSPGALNYAASVGNDVDHTTVSATPRHSAATVTIMPADDDPATAGHQVDLDVGDNDIMVRVRAEDGTEQTYSVRVTRQEGGGGNRSPAAAGAIPARTLAPGDTATVDASAYFSDPDGDALTYSAASSNANVAQASVSGSTVTIAAVALGSATITVTARDPGGLTASQEARVTVSSDEPQTERDILVALYDATGGAGWTNSAGWLTDAPVGDWHGVTTDSDGRVTALHLQSNRLTGGIPAELGSLTGLEQLYLQRNQLSGSIPAELGGLASLQWLLLNNNALSGAVPADLGRLSALAGLLLNDNADLAGALPLALSSLSALELFRYDGTGLCVPADASFRAWLDAIRTHRGTGVDCEGSPDASLSALSLSGVTLHPAFSPGAFSYTASVGNDVATTTVEATASHGAATVAIMPADADTATAGHQVGLDVGDNDITARVTAEDGTGQTYSVRVTRQAGDSGNRSPAAVGTIPARTLAPGGTATVDISGYFSDPDGDVLTYVASSSSAGVATASVSSDTVTVAGVAEGSATIRITATDPGGLSAAQPFTVTVAGGGGNSSDRAALAALYHATGGPNWADNTNWLTDAPLGNWYGVTTDASGRVVRLTLGGHWDFDAGEYVRHGLTGPMPPELGGLVSLRTLDLGINELTGVIPAELGQLTRLEDLRLGINNLTGVIPTELDQLTRLEDLWLSSNDLSGTVPRGLGNLSRLRNLSLGFNELTGPIPQELGNLAGLRYLDLSGNNLTRSIPRELGNLSRLETLDLSSNELTGPIATELGRLTNLRQLDLSINELAGPVPAELGQLASLQRLGLSWNQLSGGIPAELGRLSGLTGLFLQYNTELAGALPLSLASLSKLENLWYAGTGLCVPADAAFRAWLNAIADHRGTDVNCSGGGGAPDLVVQSPAVDDGTPGAGALFTFSATVRNRGDGQSGSTTLRYYRSSNATISPSDTEVGADPVDVLRAGASSPETVALTAPSQDGTYYFGACVDSVDGESHTGNNCSDGVEVEVSGGGTGRDGECVRGATYGRGESCDVYGTGSSSKVTFTVLSDGRARFWFLTSASRIVNTGSINGVTYHFVASHQGGGIWRIDEYIP